MKFKLLAGNHIAADTTKSKVSFLPNIPDDQKMYPDRRYKQGDIIDCEEDLCAVFNQPGIPPKFERVDQYAGEGWTPPAPKDGLEDLTVKQLNELAEAYEIDLKGVKVKDGIVRILRAFDIKPEVVGG